MIWLCYILGSSLDIAGHLWHPLQYFCTTSVSDFGYFTPKTPTDWFCFYLQIPIYPVHVTAIYYCLWSHSVLNTWCYNKMWVFLHFAMCTCLSPLQWLCFILYGLCVAPVFAVTSSCLCCNTTLSTDYTICHSCMLTPWPGTCYSLRIGSYHLHKQPHLLTRTHVTFPSATTTFRLKYRQP
jgi:hypothetical protein